MNLYHHLLLFHLLVQDLQGCLKRYQPHLTYHPLKVHQTCHLHLFQRPVDQNLALKTRQYHHYLINRLQHLAHLAVNHQVLHQKRFHHLIIHLIHLDLTMNLHLIRQNLNPAHLPHKGFHQAQATCHHQDHHLIE